MKFVTANEAKTKFGDLLIQAQRNPVQINKNGKAVAVVMSIDDYVSNESLKLQLLQMRLHQARVDMANSDLIDGENFFNSPELRQSARRKD